MRPSGPWPFNMKILIAPVTRRGLNVHSLPWNAVTFCARSGRALSGGGLTSPFVGVTLRVHANESPTASSVAHSGIAAMDHCEASILADICR